MLKARTPALTPVLGRARHRLRASPLLRHLLLALVGLLLVVLVIESVSSFRQVQLATMAYTGIAAGGLAGRLRPRRGGARRPRRPGRAGARR